MSTERPEPTRPSDEAPPVGHIMDPGHSKKIEAIALALSAVWLAMVALFYLVMPSGEGSGSVIQTVMILVAIALPIALIWVAAITARTAREMRNEAANLRASVEAMRAVWTNTQAASSGQHVERKLAEIAAATRQTETAVATFASRRDNGATQPSANRKAALVTPAAVQQAEQPSLALGTPAEDLRAPVSVADFIRALNFPDNAEDKEGFRALRRALEDRSTAKLIRAAQDVLNLIAQDGIYMDDLNPDRARPELWRRFAQGERGREIATIGGVRDRSSIALCAGRMRADTIFRDAAHHFLRQFDKTFSEFEQNATDQELAELAQTRTARAFMLLGRVTGTFD